jgi:RNA polymerase sigma-70 factor (ECF subfamily)
LSHTPDFSTSFTLLRRIQQSGDDGAWQTFWERYRPLIGRWCHRCGLPHADAEDISAEVIRKLGSAIRRYDPSRPFRPWLKTIVLNEVRGFWRLQERRPGDWGSGDPAVHERLGAVEAPDPFDELASELAGEVQRDLEECVPAVLRAVQARVSSEYWEVYWLRVIDGLSSKQVAERLELTVTKVNVAKYRVKKLLEEEGQKVLASRARLHGGEP